MPKPDSLVFEEKKIILSMKPGKCLACVEEHMVDKGQDILSFLTQLFVTCNVSKATVKGQWRQDWLIILN